MQTTTTVSLGTFSTASRYPLASTSSKVPHTLLLGLCRLCAAEPLLSSSLSLFSLHCLMKSSSSLSPSSLSELPDELFSLFGSGAVRGCDEFEKAPFVKAARVLRKVDFFARLNACASDMTPLGPVLALKRVVGRRYVAVVVAVVILCSSSSSSFSFSELT